MDSYAGGGVVHRRVPPFGHPRITAHVRLPADFRSLSRPSSAPSAGASAPRSSSVDLEFDSDFSLFRFVWASACLHASALDFGSFRLNSN